MKKYEAILSCYGEIEIKQKIEITIKKNLYSSWMIEGIKNRKELKKRYTKKQIIEIYESGI